jgi:hypothetical protein
MKSLKDQVGMETDNKGFDGVKAKTTIGVRDKTREELCDKIWNRVCGQIYMYVRTLK